MADNLWKNLTFTHKKNFNHLKQFLYYLPATFLSTSTKMPELKGIQRLNYNPLAACLHLLCPQQVVCPYRVKRLRHFQSWQSHISGQNGFTFIRLHKKHYPHPWLDVVNSNNFLNITNKNVFFKVCFHLHFPCY